MFNKKRIIIFVVFILLMFFMTTFAGTPVQNAAIAMRDVIFTDGYNGRNLAEYQIEVGKDVTPPETPKHEGYAFAGWYNYTDRSTRVDSFKTILNDLHVIALYGEDLNKNGIVDSEEEHYLVSFVNSVNYEVIKEEEVLVGMDATAPSAPAMSGYRFMGWDRSYRNIRSDLTVYTVYNRNTTNNDNNDNDNNPKTYTVTFIDGVTNKKISSVTVREGLSAGTPNVPTHEGKTFDKWEGNYTNVKKNETVTAVYKDIKFSVLFLNDDGSELQFEEVVYGTMAAYNGEEPTKAATAQYTYTFNGWDKELAKVYENVTYTATYSKTTNKYTVKFVNHDGNELQNTKLEYGQTPAYNGATPTKPETAEYTYTFAGWDKEITEVTGDVTYTATFEGTKKQYLIKFLNYEGTELQSERLDYGELPVYKGDRPTKPATAQYTYTFRGWDKQIREVTVNESYIAQFKETINSYTVKFVNDDGTELQSSTVNYGVKPSYTGETPTKEPTAQYTYTFTGWDKELADVTADVTYTATYSSVVNEYTIKFVNYEGTELQSTNVAYGTVPRYTEETPTRAADAEFTYTFAGWDKEIVAVEGNVTYTATYTSKTNSYKVEIDPNCETGESCTKPEDQTVDYGKEATLPTISRNYKLYFSVDGNTNVFTPMNASATLLGYCLEGTDCSELVEAGTKVTVTGNAKYKAVWNNEGLTITGDLPTPSDDVEHGKKFINWTETSAATSNVVNTPIKLTSDKTIYAHFGQTKIKVEVSVGGDIANGNIEYDQELIYTIKITNEGDLGGSVFVSDPKLKEAIANGLVVLASGNTNEAKAIVEDGLTLNNVTGSKTITLKVIVKANAGDKVKTSLQYKVDGYDKTPVETTSNVEKTITFIGKSERLVGSNVVIVIDKSASMDENGKAAKAKAAAKAFIDSIFVDNNTNAYGTTISVVTFGTKWEYAEDEEKYNRLKYCVDNYFWGWPGNDCEALYNSLENSPAEKVKLQNIATDYTSAQALKNEIDTRISDTTDYYGGSGTPYYAGFELANEVLSNYTSGPNKNDNQNVVIFLTDGEPELDDETKRQEELNKLEAKNAIIYAIGFDMTEFKCTRWNPGRTVCKKYSTTERTDEYKLLKRITDYQHSDGYADRVIMSGVSGLIEVFENLGSRISSEPKSIQTSNGRLDMGPVIAVDKKHPIIVSVNGTEATASNEVADNSHEFIVYSGGVKDNTRTFARYTEAITQGYLTHDDETGYDINAAEFNPADKIKVEFFISYSE